MSDLQPLIDKWTAKVAQYERNMTTARSYETAISMDRHRDLCQQFVDDLTTTEADQ